jgi:hypothetical protein
MVTHFLEPEKPRLRATPVATKWWRRNSHQEDPHIIHVILTVANGSVFPWRSLKKKVTWIMKRALF